MFRPWWVQQKQWPQNPPKESSHYRSKNILLWDSAAGGFVWFLKFPTNKRQAQSFNQRKAACPKEEDSPIFHIFQQKFSDFTEEFSIFPELTSPWHHLCLRLAFCLRVFRTTSMSRSKKHHPNRQPQQQQQQQQQHEQERDQDQEPEQESSTKRSTSSAWEGWSPGSRGCVPAGGPFLVDILDILAKSTPRSSNPPSTIATRHPSNASRLPCTGLSIGSACAGGFGARVGGVSARVGASVCRVSPETVRKLSCWGAVWFMESGELWKFVTLISILL